MNFHLDQVSCFKVILLIKKNIYLLDCARSSCGTGNVLVVAHGMF